MRWIAVLVLLIPTVTAGCGGGSPETSRQVTGQQSAGSASRADYIELADAICRNHQSRREDLESQARKLEPLTTPGKAHAVGRLLHEEARNIRTEAADLEARQPPPAQHANFTFVIQDIRARGRAIDRWATAYDRLDEPAIRRGQLQVGRVAAAGESAARKYGFTTCGR